MPQVELSYAKRPLTPWYQQRWFHRLAILLAVLWLGWTLVEGAPPYWYRYRCYRLQEQACQFPTTPEEILLDYSPPGPAVSHAAASVVQFHNELCASRSNAVLGTSTSALLAGTPVFCHSLKTPKGAERLIQIYAQIIDGPRGMQTVNFLATSSGIVDWSLILWSPEDPINAAFSSIDSPTAELGFSPTKSLKIFGGSVAPDDPSVAEIKFDVDGQIFPVRFHLGDKFDDTPNPRMAIEGLQAMFKAGACMLEGTRGFNNWHEWPIAPPRRKN